MRKIRKKREVFSRAISENVMWFSQFSPLEKLAIYERHLKRVKRLQGLALRCLSSKR